MSDPRKTPEWRILECIHNTKSYQPHTKWETEQNRKGEKKDRKEQKTDRETEGTGGRVKAIGSYQESWSSVR